jgi:hypothetical protein
MSRTSYNFGKRKKGSGEWNGNMENFTQSGRVADVSSYGGGISGVAGMKFSYDKTKLMLSAATYGILNVIGTNINEWTLFDSGTMNGNDARTAAWNNDGTRQYQGIFNIYQHNLSTPYKLSTGARQGTNYNNANWSQGMCMAPDGMKMILSKDNSVLEEYNLHTAFTIPNNPVLVQSKAVGWQPYGIAHYNEGKNLLIMKSNTGLVYKGSVSTPYTLNDLNIEFLFDAKTVVTGNQGAGAGLNAVEIIEETNHLYLGDGYGNLWQISYDKP